MSAPQGSHIVYVDHDATYESMKHHTSSWQELYDFLHESKWKENSGKTDHIEDYELWHEGSKLGGKQEPYLKALKQIMRHPNHSKGDLMKETLKNILKPKRTEPKQGETIADALCDAGHGLSQLYTRAGHQHTHFVLFINPLWIGASGKGRMVVMILMPFSSHHDHLLQHMVILFDTHLRVFVVLHHGSAADGHTHQKADIEVFFPDGKHQRRELHKHKDEWSLHESSH